MANSKQRTKQSHYVPRAAYLEYFAEKSDGKTFCWVYPVTKDGIQYENELQIPPDQLCRERYLYESPVYPVNEIEKALEKVESSYRKILDEKILKRAALSKEEKKIVSLFLSTFEARNPAAKNGLLKFLDDIDEKARIIEEHHGVYKPSQTRVDIKKAKNSYFANYVAIAGQLNRWQFSSFLFLDNSQYYDESNGMFFITSDRPVNLYDFTFMNSVYGIPPNSATAELIVPLSPTMLLFANNQGLEGYDDIFPNFISEANNRVAYFAQNRIISPHKIGEQAVKRIGYRNRQSFILEYKFTRKKKESTRESNK